MTDDRSERLRQRRKRSTRGAKQRRDGQSAPSTDGTQQRDASIEWANSIPNPTTALQTIRSTLSTTASRYRQEQISTDWVDLARCRRLVTSGWRWLAIDGDRRIVTLVLLGVGFLVFGPVGFRLSIFPLELFAGQRGTVALLSTLLVVGATVVLFLTVVAVVSFLAVFVFLLPDQQSPLHQQLSPTHNADQVRHRLAELSDSTNIPTDLEPQLRLLAAELLDRALRLQGDLATAGVNRPEDLDVDVASLVAETRAIKQQLAETNSAFDVLRATMEFDCDSQLSHLRDLQERYGDPATENTAARIDELLELLQHFVTTRQSFKTLYTRQEFTILARDLVLLATPALALLIPLLYYLHSSPTNHLVVSVVNLLVLAPLVLIASYGLRAAVISKLF